MKPTGHSAALRKEQLWQQIAQLSNDKTTINFLIDTSLSANSQEAFHAAWMLESLALENPLLFAECFENFLLRFVQITNGSAKRHFGKILLHFLTLSQRDPAIASRLWQCNLEPAAMTCLDWMNPCERVAVRIYAMDCLFWVGQRYPWAMSELASSMELLQRNALPSMQVRLKRLQKKAALNI
ncbi:hypothetical protein FACS1894156_8510 [Bacteroidia bacterium]|nr:hypothetical protein FACS1894156_8510 [Bacteroidia bacterium]